MNQSGTKKHTDITWDRMTLWINTTTNTSDTSPSPLYQLPVCHQIDLLVYRGLKSVIHSWPKMIITALACTQNNLKWQVKVISFAPFLILVMQAAALPISSEFWHDSFSEAGGTMREEVKRHTVFWPGRSQFDCTFNILMWKPWVGWEPCSAQRSVVVEPKLGLLIWYDLSMSRNYSM